MTQDNLIAVKVPDIGECFRIGWGATEEAPQYDLTHECNDVLRLAAIAFILGA